MITRSAQADIATDLITQTPNNRHATACCAAEGRHHRGEIALKFETKVFIAPFEFHGLESLPVIAWCGKLLSTKISGNS